MTGPVEYAIDGKDETGWGIDAGPGLRNQPRKAVFNTAGPIGNSGSTILIFYLKQNHGGWNSDDNQTNNLGRIRLSITTAENAEADPLPAAVREVLAIPSEQRTPEQMETVFSYWRTTVPEWRPSERRDRSIVEFVSRRLIATGTGAARGGEAYTRAYAWRLSETRKTGGSGNTRVSESDAGRSK